MKRKTGLFAEWRLSMFVRVVRLATRAGYFLRYVERSGSSASWYVKFEHGETRRRVCVRISDHPRGGGPAGFLQIVFGRAFNGASFRRRLEALVHQGRPGPCASRVRSDGGPLAG